MPLMEPSRHSSSNRTIAESSELHVGSGISVIVCTQCRAGESFPAPSVSVGLFAGADPCSVLIPGARVDISIVSVHGSTSGCHCGVSRRSTFNAMSWFVSTKKASISPFNLHQTSAPVTRFSCRTDILNQIALL